MPQAYFGLFLKTAPLTDSSNAFAGLSSGHRTPRDGRPANFSRTLHEGTLRCCDCRFGRLFRQLANLLASVPFRETTANTDGEHKPDGTSCRDDPFLASVEFGTVAEVFNRAEAHSCIVDYMDQLFLSVEEAASPNAVSRFRRQKHEVVSFFELNKAIFVQPIVDHQLVSTNKIQRLGQV